MYLSLVPKLKNTLYIENHPDIGQPTPFTHPHLFDSIDEGRRAFVGFSQINMREGLHKTFRKKYESKNLIWFLL